MARRRNSNRRRRGRFSFLYKLLSTLIICGVIVAALTLFFRVDDISVSGSSRYTAEEVAAATGVRQGDNLFLLNKQEVRRSLQNALPYVEDIRLNKQLPDTLVVEILKECETPLAVVQDGSAWLVSARGMVVEQLAASQADGYGVIDGCELLAPSVGTSIALATEYAAQQSSLLELLQALEDAGMLTEVDAIHLEDTTQLTMDYAQRFCVELPYNTDYPYRLQYLQAVIDKLEVNMTGTIQLTRNDGEVHFIED